MNRNWSITSSNAVIGAMERIEGRCILLVYCACSTVFVCDCSCLIVLYCILF